MIHSFFLFRPYFSLNLKFTIGRVTKVSHFDHIFITWIMLTTILETLIKNKKNIMKNANIKSRLRLVKELNIIKL